MWRDWWAWAICQRMECKSLSINESATCLYTKWNVRTVQNPGGAAVVGGGCGDGYADAAGAAGALSAGGDFIFAAALCEADLQRDAVVGPADHLPNGQDAGQGGQGDV